METVSTTKYNKIDLPEILSVLHMKSTILLPKAQLPICMSSISYLDIASELIENNIIGVIQPTPTFSNSEQHCVLPQPFKIGCAGQIKEIGSSEDEVTIIIQGLCRFETVEVLPTDKNGLDRIRVSYDKYKIDLEEHDNTFDKSQLLTALNLYFKHLEIYPNWPEIEKTPPEVLISALAMACPFHPSEKQSLLETVNIQDQSEMITKIIEMNSFNRFHSTNTIN